MITEDARAQLSEIFIALSDALDVPPEIDRQLKDEYAKLALFVREDSVDRHRTDSEIYAQGSRRTGTIVAPVRAGQDFDLDIVYLRHLKRESVTQYELKLQAGDQLTRYLAWRRQMGLELPELTEGGRCWTLTWSGRYHMDVLPALPGDEPQRVYLGHNHIIITDRELKLWQPSNPRGLAIWFRGRMERALRAVRERRATLASVHIEQIPEDEVKTPLQRVVQLLKRHRDVFYEGQPEHRPSSIIVTTLAARAYENQMDVFDALCWVVPRMREFVELRDGVFWVQNPTNLEENFADRWAKDPLRASRFFEWLAQVEADLGEVADARGIHNTTDALGRGWGQAASTAAAGRFGDGLRAQRIANALRVSAGAATLAPSGSVLIAPHTFFGAKP